jgi:hypothetical protein
MGCTCDEDGGKQSCNYNPLYHTGRKWRLKEWQTKVEVVRSVRGRRIGWVEKLNNYCAVNTGVVETH